jgi:signal peptide peptidase SppA
MDGKALRILTEFYRTPWALLPETLIAMTAVLHRWAEGVKFSDEEIRAAVGEAPQVARERIEREQQAGGDLIAVLPIFGIMGHRARLVREMSSGVGTSTEILGQMFKAAVKDPNVGAIVLDVDSPGGSAFGVDELASDIFAARGTKPIVASVNSMSASAAYWIASAADEVVVTPGGMAGSIGVWTAHEDWSTYLEKKGVKVSLVSAGKFKVEGNPYGPLDDTAREAMQDVVNKYYGAFTSAVARNRGAENAKAVRDGYGEGRVLLAKDAVKEKLADRVGTFDQVIADVRTRLEKSRPGASKRAQAARVLRLTDANA